MSEEKTNEIQNKDDYVKMLYTPENIEAAGGIDNFQKIINDWKKQDAMIGVKNNISYFVEYFGTKILGLALIIGIIIIILKVM